MEMVKVEIKSRETIKPSSPTPHSLRKFRLSFLDQLTPPVYNPMIFYYEAKTGGKYESRCRFSRLKESLSETLSHFYPLAGRVRENTTIECNDKGVDYFEAEANCSLSEVLKQTGTDVLDQLLPNNYRHMEDQLPIQVSRFTCGGMAIGFRLLHKILDGSTFGLFVKGWAASARGQGDSIQPIFVGPSLFPPLDSPGELPNAAPPQARCITKRFTINSTKITTLRAKFTNIGSMIRPSRTLIASSLIWKCAMDISRVKFGTLHPLIAAHAIDLRSRANPPFPKNSAGNLAWGVMAPPPKTNQNIELQDLMIHIKNSWKTLDADYVRKMQGESGRSFIFDSVNRMRELSSGGLESFWISSTVSFPYYEADFGWGKPIWVSSGGTKYRNGATLYNGSWDGGIDCWVTLEEQDMPIFEHNIEEHLASDLD